MSIDAAAMIRKLQACAPYTDEPFPWRTRDRADPRRADAIRRYFKDRAGLNLSSLVESKMTAWEKALTVSEFVSAHIPHDNQKEPLQKRDAISLWEYALRVPTGFNCRWHAILLSELLLSMRIKNRFVTCLPEDRNDGDCHVVNLVWLPEKEKWAMIDSDMQEYVTASDGTPLSLEEMRSELISGHRLNIHRNSDPWGVEYMQGYWAKNLYWFEAHLTYGYGLENPRLFPDPCVRLVPPGYDHAHMSTTGSKRATANAAAFWKG